MKSIVTYYGGEFKSVDEKIADIVMDEVVARARARILEIAKTGNMFDISDAVKAIDEPSALHEMFNTILDEIIPGAITICAARSGFPIAKQFDERYIDKFDEDESLACTLLRAMSDRLKNKKASSDD